MPLTSSFESPSKEKRASLEKMAVLKSTSDHTEMDVNYCINVSGKAFSAVGMDSVQSRENAVNSVVESSTKPDVDITTVESSTKPDILSVEPVVTCSSVENSTNPAVDSLSENEQNDTEKQTVDSLNVKQEESTNPSESPSDSTNMRQEEPTKPSVDALLDSVESVSKSSKCIEVPEGEKDLKPVESKEEQMEVGKTVDTNETVVKPEDIDKADDMSVAVDGKHDQISSPEKPETMEVKETEQSKSDDEEMCVDTPPRMPGRGRKRGRSSDASSVTPEPKKRAIKSDVNKTKVTHPTHPDVKIPGVPLTLGEGDVGQLGLGEDIMERGRPALVKLEDRIIQVIAGGMHSACLTSQGKVYTFGCNDESALGRDTSEEGSETLPVKVNLPYKVIQMSGGDSHTAVLTDDGHVYAWGNFRDANGSMGLTSGGIRKDPLEMLPGETTVKIVSGGDHLVCLTDKGEIFTGGCAEQGQLGRVAECFAGRGGRKGVDSILKMGAVRCKKHHSRKRAQFTDIWAGQYVTFAKEKDTGDIYSWGLNNYYQLGFSDMQNRFVPERVPSFAEHKCKWVKVQAGQHHTMLLDEEGKVYTLGRAEYGRLGLGEDSGEKTQPTLVKRIDDKKIVDIAAGQSVSLALTQDGSVYSWGMGTSKQLGTGDEEDVWEPVLMKGKQLENRVVVGLASGGQHTILLAKDKS